jgi:hypothetical protein
MQAAECKRLLKKPSNRGSGRVCKRSFARVFVLLAAVGVVFSGCSAFEKSPDKQPPVEVNLPPTNTRAGLLALLEKQLVDPVGVRDAYITEPKLQQIGTESRYVVCVRYNAKDGYGQYTGSLDFIAIYFAGKINQYIPAPADQCRNAAYQRFPELEALKRPS